MMDLMSAPPLLRGQAPPGRNIIMRIITVPNMSIRYKAKGRKISGKRLMTAAPISTPGIEPIPPIRTIQNIKHDSMKEKLSGDTHMSLLA